MWAGVSGSQGLVTAPNNNEKIWATRNVLKIERCGSSLLTSNRKDWIWEKADDISVKLQAKSAVKVVADEVYTANLENKITYEGERESD